MSKKNSWKPEDLYVLDKLIHQEQSKYSQSNAAIVIQRYSRYQKKYQDLKKQVQIMVNQQRYLLRQAFNALVRNNKARIIEIRFQCKNIFINWLETSNKIQVVIKKKEVSILKQYFNAMQSSIQYFVTQPHILQKYEILQPKVDKCKQNLVKINMKDILRFMHERAEYYLEIQKAKVSFEPLTYLQNINQKNNIYMNNYYNNSKNFFNQLSKAKILIDYFFIKNILIKWRSLVPREHLIDVFAYRNQLRLYRHTIHRWALYVKTKKEIQRQYLYKLQYQTLMSAEHHQKNRFMSKFEKLNILKYNFQKWKKGVICSDINLQYSYLKLFYEESQLRSHQTLSQNKLASYALFFLSSLSKNENVQYYAKLIKCFKHWKQVSVQKYNFSKFVQITQARKHAYQLKKMVRAWALLCYEKRIHKTEQLTIQQMQQSVLPIKQSMFSFQQINNDCDVSQYSTQFAVMKINSIQAEDEETCFFMQKAKRFILSQTKQENDLQALQIFSNESKITAELLNVVSKLLKSRQKYIYQTEHKLLKQVIKPTLKLNIQNNVDLFAEIEQERLQFRSKLVNTERSLYIRHLDFATLIENYLMQQYINPENLVDSKSEVCQHIVQRIPAYKQFVHKLQGNFVLGHCVYAGQNPVLLESDCIKLNSCAYLIQQELQLDKQAIISNLDNFRILFNLINHYNTKGLHKADWYLKYTEKTTLMAKICLQYRKKIGDNQLFQISRIPLEWCGSLLLCAFDRELFQIQMNRRQCLANFQKLLNTHKLETVCTLTREDLGIVELGAETTLQTLQDALCAKTSLQMFRDAMNLDISLPISQKSRYDLQKQYTQLATQAIEDQQKLIEQNDLRKKFSLNQQNTYSQIIEIEKSNSQNQNISKGVENQSFIDVESNLQKQLINNNISYQDELDVYKDQIQQQYTQKQQQENTNNKNASKPPLQTKRISVFDKQKLDRKKQQEENDQELMDSDKNDNLNRLNRTASGKMQTKHSKSKASKLQSSTRQVTMEIQSGVKSQSVGFRGKKLSTVSLRDGSSSSVRDHDNTDHTQNVLSPLRKSRAMSNDNKEDVKQQKINQNNNKIKQKNKQYINNEEQDINDVDNYQNVDIDNDNNNINDNNNSNDNNRNKNKNKNKDKDQDKNKNNNNYKDKKVNQNNLQKETQQFQNDSHSQEEQNLQSNIEENSKGEKIIKQKKGQAEFDEQKQNKQSKNNYNKKDTELNKMNLVYDEGKKVNAQHIQKQLNVMNINDQFPLQQSSDDTVKQNSRYSSRLDETEQQFDIGKKIVVNDQQKLDHSYEINEEDINNLGSQSRTTTRSSIKTRDSLQSQQANRHIDKLSPETQQELLEFKNQLNQNNNEIPADVRLDMLQKIQKANQVNFHDRKNQNIQQQPKQLQQQTMNAQKSLKLLNYNQLVEIENIIHKDQSREDLVIQQKLNQELSLASMALVHQENQLLTSQLLDNVQKYLETNRHKIIRQDSLEALQLEKQKQYNQLLEKIILNELVENNDVYYDNQNQKVVILENKRMYLGIKQNQTILKRCTSQPGYYNTKSKDCLKFLRPQSSVVAHKQGFDAPVLKQQMSDIQYQDVLEKAHANQINIKKQNKIYQYIKEQKPKIPDQLKRGPQLVEYVSETQDNEDQLGKIVGDFSRMINEMKRNKKEEERRKNKIPRNYFVRDQLTDQLNNVVEIKENMDDFDKLFENKDKLKIEDLVKIRKEQLQKALMKEKSGDFTNQLQQFNKRMFKFHEQQQDQSDSDSNASSSQYNNLLLSEQLKKQKEMQESQMNKQQQTKKSLKLLEQKRGKVIYSKEKLQEQIKNENEKMKNKSEMLFRNTQLIQQLPVGSQQVQYEYVKNENKRPLCQITSQLRNQNKTVHKIMSSVPISSFQGQNKIVTILNQKNQQINQQQELVNQINKAEQIQINENVMYGGFKGK